MGDDQAIGQLLDVRTAVRDCQSLDVTGPIKKLVLQREVSEKRLAERLRLLGQRLDRGSRTAQQRSDDVGESAKIADGGLDASARARPFAAF